MSNNNHQRQNNNRVESKVAEVATLLVTRTERIWLKPFKILARFCHLSKNLYNEGNYLIRQQFFTDRKWLRYNQLYHQIKTSENYQQLPAMTAQQTLKVLDRNWSAFFKTLKVWNEDKKKFLGRPRPPKYKPKKGEFLLIFTYQQVKLKNSILTFPKKLNELTIKTRLPDSTNIREVRIVPKGKGYICEIVYKKRIDLSSLTLLNKDNILAIDLGITNLITAVNNNGLRPFIIKGGVVKSINHYYNKKRAQLQSIYSKQGLKKGLRLISLTIKRNNKLNDYFHKVSRRIIDYCLTNNIGTLVIGYNKQWKQKSQMSKKNNQNFVTIPYYQLIHQLEYKAEEQGITVITQEESYSSKCSFLDNESIAKHEHYLGRRITRGLFKSSKGTIINADVNGAYNILKKAFPKAISAIADGIEVVKFQPVCWRSLEATP